MKIDRVNRVEVIDETGRAYVKYLDNNQEVVYSLQDDGCTLKLFINKKADFDIESLDPEERS
jgi:hypothetical protein